MESEWKVGKVIPIHKSGNKHSPLHYRPISLTSIPCKILEHILASHLAMLLESHSYFAPSQHGFRKSYSCETQLTLFVHKLTTILDNRSLADCIFLDFSKAFDKVCHKLLIYKLRLLNLDPCILIWIESFLANRSQFVSANGANSEECTVHSGVPQGSVLGPLLFLIYFNDLPSCISSSVHLFADDCVIFREITGPNDAALLQADINAVFEWCNTWLMELNTKKGKFMRVSRKITSLPIYHLNNVLLDSVSSYKYLGVHISSNLPWDTHISHVVCNANRMLGYFRRNFAKSPSSLKLMLYKTLIRPKLEYAASVWDPHHNNLVHSLEMVQNNSVRFILSNYNRISRITVMKANLKLPTLASRRAMLRSSLFHKLYHHPYLRDLLILPPYYVSHRLDHAHKVGIPLCKTESFLQSYIPRTSNDWNCLPKLVVTLSDHEKFVTSITNAL